MKPEWKLVSCLSDSEGFYRLEDMMRKLSWMLLLLLTVSLWAVEGDEAENQEPVVSNPIAKQLDYEHVLVSYDVKDVDGDLMTISVKVSDDGGKTFGLTVPLEQLSGDVGEGVSSGKGKEIIWTIAVDEFLHIYETSCKKREMLELKDEIPTDKRSIRVRFQTVNRS